ncbi:hypothetical protein SNE40_013018 [Patella caerulea]|uniref:DUF4371 domain-containing protein n=1 Tax=Patella caerulea TaxID=87958 RepID=A0AAN8JQN1_PATCE
MTVHVVVRVSQLNAKLVKNVKIKSYRLKQFHWLKIEGGYIFCKLCLQSGRSNVFTSGKDTNNPKSDDFKKHERSTDHKFSIAKAISCVNTKIKTGIISIMKNVYWLIKEEMPKDKLDSLNKLLIDQGFESLNILGSNTNNLNKDSNEQSGLKLSYTSHNSVDDMIRVFADIIETDNLSKIKGSKFYSLIFDESTDTSNIQNLIIYIRFVTNGIVRTKFLAIKELDEGCTAAEIYKLLKHTLEEKDLNQNNLISLGTDGASTMVGSKTGVTTRFKLDNPLILSFHCAAH